MLGIDSMSMNSQHIQDSSDSDCGSSVLFIASLPFSWNVNNVKSVMKGTGPIVEIRLRMDNQNKNKGFCFIEYLTPQDAIKAIPLILQIKLENGRKRFRVEISKEPFRKIDPENPQQTKYLQQLTRDFLPRNVILPSTIISPEEFNVLQGRIYDVNNDTPNNNIIGNMILMNNPNNMAQPIMNLPPQPQFNNNVIINNNLKTMPDNLVNASKVLPPFVKEYFSTDKDAISTNLRTVPPPQMIQLIANMKNLLDSGNIDSVDHILASNPDISISVAQVLLLIGFIDNDVITEALSQPSTTSASPASSPATGFVQQANYSGNIVGSSLQPMNALNFYNQNPNNGQYPSPVGPTITKHVSMGNPVTAAALTPKSLVPAVNSKQDDLQPFARRATTNVLQPVRKHLAAPYPQATATANGVQPNVLPVSQQGYPQEWSQFKSATIHKLQLLDRTQADNVVKILTLPIDQINMLPVDQQAVINQLKTEYL